MGKAQCVLWSMLMCLAMGLRMVAWATIGKHDMMSESQAGLGRSTKCCHTKNFEPDPEGNGASEGYRMIISRRTCRSVYRRLVGITFIC